jgi:Thoeris protein ThsB, TIR-like domain
MATKKKVFVSFDFDNDKIIKDFLIGQSKHEDSPFEVTDVSLKEAAPEKDWEAKAKTNISKAEIVIVMVGPKTYKAPGVLKEVKIANDLKKKIIQIIGYKDGDYTRVEGAGILYSWNWENLKRLLN